MARASGVERKGWEFASWTLHSSGEDVGGRGSRISVKLVGILHIRSFAQIHACVFTLSGFAILSYC